MTIDIETSFNGVISQRHHHPCEPYSLTATAGLTRTIFYHTTIVRYRATAHTKSYSSSTISYYNRAISCDCHTNSWD